MFKLSFIATLLLTSASLLADCCGAGGGGNIFSQNSLHRDFPLVKQDIDSKRSIPVEEKSKNLSFSGDIRTLWSHTSEKFCNKEIRGISCDWLKKNECLADILPEFCDPQNKNSGKIIPFPRDAFGVEFNLYVDYSQDSAWGVVWVQYSNAAGLVGALRTCGSLDQACRGSGTCEGICLRKAYMGYNIISDGSLRIDIEAGRRPLWTIFDSRLQFNQNFDGLLLSTAYNLTNCSDLYLNVGGFVIDERVHHYGLVGETGYLGVLNSPLDIKYSLISWKKSGPNRCGETRALGNQYLVSQITAYYNLNYDFLWNQVRLYGAYLVNSAAKRQYFLNNKKQNQGFYAGFITGQICKQGDWALDVNYQYVQALAVPETDSSGIGNGNALGDCFLCAIAPENARGRTNYKGWRFETLYAFSDNLVLDVLLQFSSTLDRELGGRHSFSQFQLQAIYAF